jgi:hypothetical protein
VRETLLFIAISIVLGSAHATSTAGPTAPCEMTARPQWLTFFCRFMTDELYRVAGNRNPGSTDAFAAWTPFFDEKTGVLEGLARMDEKGAVHERRYTPWSTHLKAENKCAEAGYLNPYFLALPSNSAQWRSQILGLGWQRLPADPQDPTQAFEPGAMFIMFTAANITRSGLKSSDQSVRAVLFGAAYESGVMRPEYERDGEISLVAENGSVTKIDDLEEAAQQLRRSRVLFVNDMEKTWREGLQDAIAAVRHVPHSTFVYVYLAQNLLGLPSADNTLFRNRLALLVRRTASDHSNGDRIAVFSTGWSSHIVGSAISAYPNRFEHTMLVPSPGPWGEAEMERDLRSGVKTNINIGTKDPIGALGFEPLGSRFTATCLQ